MVTSPVGMGSYFLFAYLVIFHDFLSSADFNQLFRKIISGILSECQGVWIQVRHLGFKLFVKIISRQQNLPLAGKEFFKKYVPR